MSFFQELLHMFWGGSSSSGLQQNSSSQERNNGQHLCRCSQLQDREQVSEVVTENVASTGDSVQTFSGTVAGQSAGISRLQELNVQTLGVMISQVLGHQMDQVSIVSSGRVQPKYSLSSSSSRNVRLFENKNTKSETYLALETASLTQS